MAQHDGLKQSLDAFEEGAEGKLEAGVRDEVNKRFYAAYEALNKTQWEALEAAVLKTSQAAGSIALSLAGLNGSAAVTMAHALPALRAVRDVCGIDLPDRRIVCRGVNLERDESQR
jgi:hypothetical protein